MLDPSIGLNTKRPPPVDMYAGVERGMNLAALAMRPEQIQQSIAASKATQALTEAHTPGVVAQATQQQQAALKAIQDQAANQHAIDLAVSGKYTIEKDGKKNIDYPRLYGDLSQKFPQQALAMAKTKGDTDYQTALASKAGTEATSAIMDFSRRQVQTMANVIEKSEATPAQKVEALKDGIGRLADHYPEAFQDSPYVILDPKSGKKTFTTMLDASHVKQIADGSMDPLTSATLKISENQLALAQLQASPGYKQTISTIQSPEIRVAALGHAAEQEAYLKDIMSGKNASMGTLPTKAGSIVADKWNQYVLQNPEAAKKERAIGAYNARYGTAFSIPQNGIATIDTLLAKEADKVDKLAKTNREVATQPNIPAAAEAAPAAPKISEAVKRPKTGDIVDGYQFLGGNVNDKKRWVKVK